MNSLFMLWPRVAGDPYGSFGVQVAEVGDELTAEGRVVRSGKRVGISEMTVTNQEGKLIARATGTTIPVA